MYNVYVHLSIFKNNRDIWNLSEIIRNFKKILLVFAEGEPGGSCHGNWNMSSSDSFAYWDPEQVDEALLLPGDVKRMSVCELEVDCMADDILNREEKRCSELKTSQSY